MLIFPFSKSSFQNRFCITIKFSIIFKESSVSSEQNMFLNFYHHHFLIFTFSLPSFQNHFCITMKFSNIFSESSQFHLNKISLKESSIILNFTFSMSSFQNRFCIKIKFLGASLTNYPNLKSEKSAKQIG